MKLKSFKLTIISLIMGFILITNILGNTHIFVSDPNDDRIQIYDSSVNYVTMISDPLLSAPSELSHNGTHLFITNGNFVYTFNSSNEIVNEIETDTAYPQIKVSQDLVFKHDLLNSTIHIYDTYGEKVIEFGGHGSDNGKFIYPSGLYVNEYLLLVADENNQRIQIFFYSALGPVKITEYITETENSTVTENQTVTENETTTEHELGTTTIYETETEIITNSTTITVTEQAEDTTNTLTETIVHDGERRTVQNNNTMTEFVTITQSQSNTFGNESSTVLPSPVDNLGSTETLIVSIFGVGVIGSMLRKNKF